MHTTPGAQAPPTQHQCQDCGDARASAVGPEVECCPNRSFGAGHRWVRTATAPPPTRHADAIALAAHIVTENPTTDPAALAASVEALWSPNMWRTVAGDAGVAQPDTATQALTVAILRGPAGTDVVLTNESASIAEVALRRYGRGLAAETANPQRDALLRQVGRALHELAPPIAAPEASAASTPEAA